MQMIYHRLLRHYDDLLHAFTTRHGGISGAPWHSANIAFHVGDDAADVLANHDRLSALLGYGRQALVHMRQIHSDRVVVVEETHGFDTPPECDALVTDRSGVPLMVMTADCTPILLFEPQKRVIAAVHAGRAGAFSDIAGKTVDVMCERFGCDPAAIIAVLGPSIHACCYEVGETIAGEAEAAGFGYAVMERGGSHYLDVNAIITEQLLARGVKEEHLEAVEACSSCEKERFFSYRADAQKTGRMAGVIMLR